MAYIKGEDRNQLTLFPNSIDEYISDDNPVRVIEAFVGSLDIVKNGDKIPIITGEKIPTP